MIQAVVLIVGMLAGVSLILGGVVGLAVVLWAQDVAEAMPWVINGFYALVGLMPIALWLALYMTHDDLEYSQAYNSQLRAVLTTLQGAIVGSILGAGPIFLAVIVNLPVILGNFNISEFGPTVREAIVWSRLWLALAATVGAAFPLGFWAYYTSAGRDD